LEAGIGFALLGERPLRSHWCILHYCFSVTRLKFLSDFVHWLVFFFWFFSLQPCF